MFPKQAAKENDPKTATRSVLPQTKPEHGTPHRPVYRTSEAKEEVSEHTRDNEEQERGRQSLKRHEVSVDRNAPK